jgi:hypothetical protein|tara:strand:- start:1076 stop:1303 length:228 start_codon:yes stop_codon:yes gene_type:complete
MKKENEGWYCEGVECDIDTMVIEGVDGNDYPKFCDAFVSEMKDVNGNDVSDEVLDKFTEEFGEFINDVIHNEQLY